MQFCLSSHERRKPACSLLSQYSLSNDATHRHGQSVEAAVGATAMSSNTHAMNNLVVFMQHLLLLCDPEASKTPASRQ